MERSRIEDNMGFDVEKARAKISFWHVYSKDQIKPNYQGDIVYFLTFSGNKRTPVGFRVFDSGTPLEEVKSSLDAYIESKYHGIIFCGINKDAVRDAVTNGPIHLPEDKSFTIFNYENIRHSRGVLLSNTNHKTDNLDSSVVALLSGLTFLIPGYADDH